MEKFNNLQQRVISWADDKNLLKPECIAKQKLCIEEEFGEMVGAIRKGNLDNLKEEFGDVLVTIIVYAKQLGAEDSKIVHTKAHKDFPFETLKRRVYFLFSENDHIYILPIVLRMIENFGFEATDCLEVAYNKIKNRKGVSREGTFVKQEDI